MIKKSLKIVSCFVGFAFASISYAEQNNLNYLEDPVCPAPGTWVNCIPGPSEVITYYCLKDIRAWVEANCPDVHYAV